MVGVVHSFDRSPKPTAAGFNIEPGNQKFFLRELSLLQVIDHHKRFLHHCLQGTVLKTKMVRNLNQLKGLVYEFSRQSELLEVDAEYLEPEPLDRYGELLSSSLLLSTCFLSTFLRVS